MTIKHLLTHTSGLSYDDDAPGVPALYKAANIWSAASLADFVAKVATPGQERIRPRSDPGGARPAAW